jgi:hypothetical protein
VSIVLAVCATRCGSKHDLIYGGNHHESSSSFDSALSHADWGLSMSKMVQLVDEFRERLTTVADTESKLVAQLRDALHRYDQKLLQDVRSITAEHENRRGVILGELQGLAARMGAFPVARETRAAVSDAAPAEARPALPSNGRLRPVEGGAWREATDKLQNEIDTYFKKRA